MRNQISQHGNWFENLENRRLLSASADALVLDALSAQQAFVMSPMVTTPSIVGTFTGTCVNSKYGNGTLSVVINTQTSRGTITGTDSIKFAHQHTQNLGLSGKIRGDSITLTQSDGTVITGTASQNGHVLSGAFKKVNGPAGTFSVSRPGHRG